MNLSEKIAIVRKARRYSQEELGDKIGVSRQSVSEWEKGKFEPTLENIRAIAQVLDVSFDTLLNEKVDLSDDQVLNVALKNLDSETKGKINKSYRYRIRQYTVTKKDYAKVIIYFAVVGLLAIAAIVNAFFIKSFTDIHGLIELSLAIFLATGLAILSLPISKIKEIMAGGCNYSFGTLSETHLVIIGWSDSKFDRTVYIPVTEVESMELAKNAKRKHGSVIVHIKGRNKPLVTADIVEPQKLIDVFNNSDTFVEYPDGK